MNGGLWDEAAQEPDHFCFLQITEKGLNYMSQTSNFNNHTSQGIELGLHTSKPVPLSKITDLFYVFTQITDYKKHNHKSQKTPTPPPPSPPPSIHTPHPPHTHTHRYFIYHLGKVDKKAMVRNRYNRISYPSPDTIRERITNH